MLVAERGCPMPDANDTVLLETAMKESATVEAATVAIARHRREITKRLTRKQTDLRIEALRALDGPPVDWPSGT